MRHLRIILVGLLATLLLLAGCGGGAKKAAEKTGATAHHARVIPLEGSGAYAHHGPLDEPPVVVAKRNRALARNNSPFLSFGPASLEWKGGVEPLSGNWAAQSDVPHCAITTSSSTVPDAEIRMETDATVLAKFGGGPVVRYHEEAEDHSCYGGRTELAQGNPYSSSKPDRRTYPGHEYWWGWRAMARSDYMSAAGSASGGMIQCHRDGSGKSPFGIGITGSGKVVAFYIDSAGAFLEKPASATVKGEAVENYLVHYDAQTSNGSWTLYMSEPGKPLVEVAHEQGVPTIVETPDCFLTNGIYRGIYTGSHPPLTLEMAGFNVGQSRASVEAVAGETTEPPPPPPVTETTTMPTPPPPAAPTAPVSLTLAVIAGPKVTAAVSPVANATGYNLYRAGRNYPGHANGTPWATATLPTFTNAYEVESKMWLCYRATAYNAVGESPKSPTACVDVP